MPLIFFFIFSKLFISVICFVFLLVSVIVKFICPKKFKYIRFRVVIIVGCAVGGKFSWFLMILLYVAILIITLFYSILVDLYERGKFPLIIFPRFYVNYSGESSVFMSIATAEYFVDFIICLLHLCNFFWHEEWITTSFVKLDVIESQKSHLIPVHTELESNVLFQFEYGGFVFIFKVNDWFDWVIFQALNEVVYNFLQRR